MNGATERKADILLWGQIPVNSNTVPGYEEYQRWHTTQVQQAIDAVGRSHPNATTILPDTGFSIDALRGGRRPTDQPNSCGEVSSVLLVMENEDYVISPKPHLQMKIVGALHRGSFTDWGSDYNPFIDLFVQIAVGLPEGWANWLKWRRRQRTKPVPEWLLEMRRTRKKHHFP